MNHFNPVWEDIFSQRDPSFYPFDNVVTFLFRNYPKDKPRSEINILEVGCGGGNNLRFAAREGFNVFGIDGSKRALKIAEQRFANENLSGEFIHGDFSSLPYEDNFFDIVIDRCSIVCVSKIAAKTVFSEIFRVLKQGGKFFFNPYSDLHTSCQFGKQLTNGITTNINHGTLVGNGDLSFYAKQELLDIFSSPWKIQELKLKKIINESSDRNDIHAEWELILQKDG